MLGNGFLPMFAPGGAAANAWTGATWATSGGNAYNTPTLGSELLTNGGFTSDTIWTKETGWTIAAGIASHVGATSGLYQVANTSGFWYQNSFDVVSYDSGNVYAIFGGISAGANRTAVGTYLQTGRAAGVGAGCGASGTASVDNISEKQITLSALFATITGASSSQTAAAKIATLTTSIQSGVVALLDSASNPQNFLIAYHNGTSVLLDKCVAGTYTNLITTTVAFTANAQIEIRRPSGNLFQLWYNGVQRGTDQTVADASIISNTRYGLFSTHSGGTFSEFSLGGVVIPFNLPGA